ncbi:response regulator [Zobellella maritima]|uniref:response regulator n=1 Tax=Zobellella maritima TaxID=2059725 RepID=UPI0018E51E64|nr:response regulator [Zobellella maritima]
MLISLARVLIGAIVVISVIYSTRAIIKTNAELDRAHQVMLQTQAVTGLARSMLINAQGFLSSGDKMFYNTFYDQRRKLNQNLDLLQQAWSQQPDKLERLRDIRQIVNDWVSHEIEPNMALRDAVRVQGNKKIQQQVLIDSLLLNNSLLSMIKEHTLALEADENNHRLEKMRLVRETTDRAIWIFTFCALIVVLSGIGLSLLATLGITRRMKRLVRAATQLEQGDLDVTVKVDSNDETGALANTFNQMTQRLRHVEAVVRATAAEDFSKQVQVQGEKDRLAQSINKMSDNLKHLATDRRNQDWMKSGLAELHYKMRHEHELLPLTQLVMTYLANYLKAQVGVCYLAEGERLKLITSYAYKKRNNNDNEFRFGEGLIGQAALEQQSILYSQMPDQQQPLTINSGMGESQPADVIVLPLVHEDRVEAVLALGVDRRYSEIELEFLERVAHSIAISIHVTRTQQQLVQLLEESKQQSEELQTQQEELKAANEELEEHADMLARSEAALRSKSEELQQLNTELEERTEELERKKAETEEKNRDIELAKQAVEIQARDLSRASQYKSEFLANMSHELRTPLNSLLILSQSLANNRQGNLTEEQQEDAKVIYQGGKALLGLINDILDLSKVEAGKLDIHFEQMTIDTLLDNLRSQFSPIASDKSIELLMEKEPGLPASISSDLLRVEQVLRNLLSNGLKFTHQGSVKLKVHKADQAVRFNNPALQPGQVIAFAVIDTGIGIAADKQQGVFEAFQQGDGSTSRVYGGTGLGLTISRELVRLLGGEIQLQSAEGQGSTFTLYLPLNGQPVQHQTPTSGEQDSSYIPFQRFAGNTPSARESEPQVIAIEQAKAVTAEPEVALPTAANPIKADDTTQPQPTDDRDILVPGDKSVLIIEDDQSFAKILIGLSRKKGYQCLAALTGSSGLQLAEQYQPSAIILDLGLPDIGGRQVLEQLKQNIKTRHIPVHILSAEDKNNEVLQMGAVGFLTKPVTGEEVEALFGKMESLLQDSIKRVLLVEDDSHNRQAVIRLIANKDVEICAVSTGREAYDKLATSAFDCVILDLTLPDISGFELLNQLSQDQQISLPPIVVYTGRELTTEEYKELSEYTSSIVIKGVSSPERLLDETTLFLHSVESSLPLNQRNIIQMLHSPEQLLQGRKILLVDDDLRNTYALSKVLREHGLEVSMADNGELALQKLAEEQDIELVLMDIMMPVMDGYEAMRRIRQQARFKSLPIIALTAKAMPEDKAKSIAAGANDYCTKPVDIDKLISMMRVWLFK